MAQRYLPASDAHQRSVERWRERHFPNEPGPNRTQNVTPQPVFTELAVGVSAQFFEMENRGVSANDNGGIDIIVEIIGQNDDEWLAMHVAMKLNRPIRPQFGDHRREVLALVRSKSCGPACGSLAPVVLELSYQHRRIPLGRLD
jgi:hypothetical protein